MVGSSLPLHLPLTYYVIITENRGVRQNRLTHAPMMFKIARPYDMMLICRGVRQLRQYAYPLSEIFLTHINTKSASYYNSGA